MRKLLIAFLAIAVCPALAAGSPILSTSAGTFATAQSLNGSFSLNALVNVLNSTTIPHVEINQERRPTAGLDYYTFNHNGGIVHLDIDTRTSGTYFDTQIGIWTAAGVLVISNDDNGGDPGDVDAPGEFSGFNSGIFNLNLPAGTYVVGVCQFQCNFGAIGFMSTNIPQGGGYILNVSASSVPEPTTVTLLSVGLAGLARRLRRRA